MHEAHVIYVQASTKTIATSCCLPIKNIAVDFAELYQTHSDLL